jgi:glycosyltransferase involved in cell wall biosynthesis
MTVQRNDLLVKNIVIYRSFYGQLSETFVRDHVYGMTRFSPMVLTNRVDACASADAVPVKVIPNRGWLPHQIWRRGWSRRAHALLRTQRPALIHAHFLADGASILPYARAHGIPLIVTAHGYDATVWPAFQASSSEGRMLLSRQDALAAYASRILCVSEFIRDELITRGYPPDRLVVQPLGVDVASIRPRPAKAGRGILAVGRLVEKKGTRYLIEAYARLPSTTRAQHPLTVIGDGPLRPDLEARAVNLGIKVDFRGSCSRDVVFDELMRTGIFCFPSVRAKSGDAEGMGIAIMEALALAVPVVMFDEQPAAPILTRGQGAVFARTADSEDLERALKIVLDDADLQLRLGQQGRVICEQAFDIHINNELIEDVYESVIRKDKRNGGKK